MTKSLRSGPCPFSRFGVRARMAQQLPRWPFLQGNFHHDGQLVLMSITFPLHQAPTATRCAPPVPSSRSELVANCTRCKTSTPTR
ncbi:hypothetical protein FA95DRAFT_1217047 [Auriscalpium vulgare]|uniref:Uncharacterized protein n=1 Tax=Auriscalpium vulgare TaxID=40419 RepID=A0ACB8R3Z5_9AGAM|nr:hypothetical protein FA95DRAFT_1217047 [Auriscalpium vulgare]